MDRRTFVERGVALATLVALGGCSETTLENADERPPVIEGRVHPADVDLPVAKTLDPVVAEIERVDGETLANLEAFAAALRERGLVVEHIEQHEEHGETILSLHVAVDGVTEGYARLIGTVAGAYAALVRDGYDGDELLATLTDDGTEFGEFEVQTDLVHEYDAGEISAAVFGSEVVHTLKTA